MGRRQPTPQLDVVLLRTASAALVLLAAHIGPARPVCAATASPQGGDAPAASARDARAPLGALEDAVRSRAARTSSQAWASVDAMLDANAKHIDAAARKLGSRVATRLAAEFGTSPRALRQRRSRLGASWGDLVIAQTVAASAEPHITAEQLIALRRNGLDWGQVAAGLGLDLADVVKAVNAEMRVATGVLPGDGKVAPIRRDGPRVRPDTGPGEISATASLALARRA